MRTLLVGPGITPTKPLMPTHMKGLVWLDLALRATRYLHPLQWIANSARVVADSTIQTIGFWAHLDRDPAMRVGEFYRDKDDVWIGDAYVRFNRNGAGVDAHTLAAYRRRIESEGWTHPVSRRVLEIWRQHYEAIGLATVGDELPVTLSVSVQEVLDTLSAHDVLLDLRSIAGPVYLDLTPTGRPLRMLIDERGRHNYVVHLLRLLLQVGPRYERLLLVHDVPSTFDFELIADVIARVGPKVERVAVGRMRLPGVQGTTRAGGWHGLTCGEIWERYRRRYSPLAFRLALRTYFIIYTPLNATEPFSHEALERALQKADRIAARIERMPEPSSVEIAELLGAVPSTPFARRTGLVEPHALMGFLLRKDVLRHHGGILKTLCG